MDPREALVVENLSKRYGSHEVLKGVSLRVPGSKTLSLLGPNGSGKTTLLNCIAGVANPDSGLIIVAGAVVFHRSRRKLLAYIPPERRNVGYVPQDYALFPHMTVYENVAIGLRARGWSEEAIRSRIWELFELLGLDRSLAGKLPAELSGGQKQLVALARALALNPDIVLMDEPFGSLDARARARARATVRSVLRRLGVPAVIVTHSFSDAWSVGDKIAFLFEGRVSVPASPDELASRPLRFGAAEFMGLQLLQGRIVDAAPGGIVIRVEGLGNLKAKAQQSELHRPGSKVVIALREDDIVVLSRENVGRSVNVYPASVEDVVVTRYGVRLFLTVGSVSLVAEVGRGLLLKEYGRLPRAGEEVLVHIPPEVVDYKVLE
ncbi:MAG: ABC transporter ATP-binding protein [Thermoproteota archaeon]